MGATASSIQLNKSPALANKHGYNPFQEFEQNRQKERADVPKKTVKDHDPSQASLLQEWIQENDAHLSDIIHHSDKDFLNLLQASTGPANTPPLNFFISNATFEGEASSESSSFRVRFQITLLKSKWTSVPLFTESVALVSSHVTYQADYTIPNLATQDPFAIIQLEPDTQAEKPLKWDEPIPDEVTTTAYTLGIYKRCYCLIASQPGTYTIDMKVLIPFATSRKTGFLVAIPRAAQNQITFKVPEKDILIKIDPCLFVSQSSDTTKSIVTARFPPADSLSVQWTENNLTSEIKAELDVKVETSATVEQKCLVSIGEGILAIYNQIDYKIVSGQMSLFEVEIDKRIKIINVEGQKDIPVKRWEIVDKKKKKKEGKEEEGETKAIKHPLLKVWLEYGIDKAYQFTIIAEMEMQSTSCKVTIPAFNCMVNADVTRDRGFVAVEARTNVEVAEIATSALDTVDVSEIPDGIYSMAENPILFGYKYLVPDFILELDVKKHADVGVLIAVVEGGHFTAGSVMQRIILRVNNTQKQYVRISVAKDVEIWSTMVNGAAVKPAMDKSGLVMIPLEKASKSCKNLFLDLVLISIANESSTTSMGEPMGMQGTLNFTFPSCDIPINQLFVSVFVPHGYKYLEFFGIKEVSYFTGTPPQPTDYQQQKQMEMEYAPRKEARKVKYAKSNAIQSASAWGYILHFTFLTVNSGGHGHRQGVVPVQVAFTTTGKEFHFERLLVTEKELALKVDYKKQSKGKTRKLGCCS